MKQIIPLVLLLATGFVAKAQVYKIQKVWAVVTESAPGRVMTDENGKEVKPTPIMERFIYIETNYKTEPKIETVLYNGKTYQSSISAVTDIKHLAGSIYSNGKPFYITPKKGNKLWRISITSGETVLRSNEAKLITIRGKLGNSSFKQTLYTETRLTGPEYQ